MIGDNDDESTQAYSTAQARSTCQRSGRLRPRGKSEAGASRRTFLIEGEDHVGALAEHDTKLAEAKINVTATDAIGIAGYLGAIVWVSARDVTKAARVLGARLTRAIAAPANESG